MRFFIEVELFRVCNSPLSKNDLLKYTSEVLRPCVVSRCFCKDLLGLHTLLSASLLSWCHAGSPHDHPGGTQVHAFSIQEIHYAGISVPVFCLSKDLVSQSPYLYEVFARNAITHQQGGCLSFLPYRSPFRTSPSLL